MKLTNNCKLSLPLAVLLSHSDYDHNSDIKTISATSLLKPIRATILEMNNPSTDKEVDLSDMIPSVFGSAVHAFAEKGWNSKAALANALKALGINEATSRCIVVNPETLKEGDIPIYIEHRSSRELNGWTIRGKFDGCVNGKLFDYKITSVWGHIFDSNYDDYSKQGSIYRWLNPTIVFDDSVSIEKVFSDWSSQDARSKKDYPKLRVLSKDYPLMSIEAIEQWMANRLAVLDQYEGSAQENIPMCSDDELWNTPDKWKYFKKAGAKRATKVYDTPMEANVRLSTEGTGEVIHFPGKVKRCIYCNVQPICTQAQSLVDAGRLDL